VVELKQQQQGMDTLKQFWHWWSSELHHLAPRWLRHYFSKTVGTLFIYVEEGSARFQLSADKEQRLIGCANLESESEQKLNELKKEFLAELPDGVRVEVYLPCEKLLVSQQFLPLATEENLASVLAFEIDRLTPFTSEQVSYGYQVKGRYPENDKIQIELCVLKNEYREKLLSRLKILGLVPDAIWPALDDAESCVPTQNLLPIAHRPVVESLWNNRVKQLGIVALLLLTFILIYPAYQLDRDVASLEEKIADIRQPAMLVGKKQSLLAARLAAQDTLVQRKNLSPGKLNIIQKVTDLLPDNTWVSRLKIDEQGVNLQGESRKASDLIELLEKSEQFQNVVFVSPITSNSSTNMERYEIKMELKGRAE